MGTLNPGLAVKTETNEFLVPAHVCELVAEMSGLQLAQDRLQSQEWLKINQLERQLAEYPQITFPLRHLFTPVPGYDELHLYTREIFMPAGSLLTSRIHLFEHPFLISAGVVSVWSNEHGWQLLCAPYRGVTLPATRRVLYIHQDTTWTTFHVTKHTDPDKVVDEVTYDHMSIGHLDDVAPEQLAVIKAAAKTNQGLIL